MHEIAILNRSEVVQSQKQKTFVKSEILYPRDIGPLIDHGASKWSLMHPKVHQSVRYLKQNVLVLT